MKRKTSTLTTTSWLNRVIHTLLIVGGIVHHTHGAVLTLNNFTSDSGHDLYLDELSVICDRGYECETGQNATIAGILFLTGNLTTDEVYISAHFEKFILNMESISRKKPINLCDSILPISSNTECPSAGTYDFIFSFPLPEINSFLIGWTLKAVVKIHDINGKVLGHFEATVPTQMHSQIYGSSSYSRNRSSNKYATILGSVTFLGLGFFAKKKARRATIQEEGNDFIMMPDSIEMSRMSSGDSVFV